MNRQELQTKVNLWLKGQSAYDMYRLARRVGEKLGVWFDNSQGYFTTRISTYTIYICYKGYVVVGLEIKRRKTDDGWEVKEVIVDRDFDNTEARIKKIHEYLEADAKESWRFELYKTPLEVGVFAFQTLKEKYPKMTASDLKNLIDLLHNEFWVIEEESEK